MKMTGEVVDILILKNPAKYQGYIVYENIKKAIYLKVLQAIYRMLMSVLLWYWKFREDLEANGFVFNNYNCVSPTI